jgi:hypothetical protein
MILDFMKTLVSKLLIRNPKIVCLMTSFFAFDRSDDKDYDARIFVLDEFRFREDIDVLRLSTNIEYIGFSNNLQDKISGIILRSTGKGADEEILVREHSKFIKEYCNIFDSIGFLSAGMFYERHALWEKSTLAIGGKFFSLHREGIGIDYKALVENVKEHVKKFRKFNGSKVMVGTESFKKILLDEGYCHESKIIVTGLPRFDKIYNFLFDEPFSASLNKNKVLLLFSFFVGTIKDYGETGLFPENEGFRELFDSIHSTVARYAIMNPDVDVYIKPKWYSGEAKYNIDRAVLHGTSHNVSEINNLFITDSLSAQTLIRMADTVIGFNSTTLVESLLYKKKVIMPIYHEASSGLSGLVAYSGFQNDFYMPRSEYELLKVIENCINGDSQYTVISDGLISEAVGFFDGKVCDRISHVLTKENLMI